MSFLDKRLTEFQSLIDDCPPNSKPVILLLDYVNMYRGNIRHHRLLKGVGPSMWNFTVLGLLVPNMSDMEHLFEREETAENSISNETETAHDTFTGRKLYLENYGFYRKTENCPKSPNQFF